MFADYSQQVFGYMPITCFKPYDIRGKLEEQLTNEVAYRIGRAYGQLLNPTSVVVGSDVRLTSETLKQHLAQGLMDAGVNVVDIGLVGTEEVYFAAFNLDVQGGIEVTASHNPMDYNGMKLVAAGAQPISSDTGLKEIQAVAEAGQFAPVAQQGSYSQTSILAAYIHHLLTYIDLTQLRPMRLVVNAGNGVAGHVIDAIETVFIAKNVPVTFIKVQHEADGNFPNGIPNPILLTNQPATANAVIDHQADIGIAWDGDFDRCFLFDEKGGFVEGYYIVGLLAEAFLQQQPGGKIIHDPRLTWNTIQICKHNAGQAIQSKTGHAFIKERMRAENAVYGGEMSAHHYFRDFAYCDSGMIPWLLVIDLLSRKNTTLSALLAERQAAFPCSGEVNFTVTDCAHSIAAIQAAFASENPQIDTTDGLSMEFVDWRMNVRASNTEPLLRLNIESRGDAELVAQKLAAISALIATA